MCCLWEMLSIICLCIILNSQFPFYEATPLIGRDVRVAYLGELPFIVSISDNILSNSEQEESSHRCGGALITTSHVLTAAHCLKDRSLDDIVVKIGSIDLRNAAVHRVKWWITFNDWSGQPIADETYNMTLHDIAIIKLLDTVSSDFDLPTLLFTPNEDLYDKSVMTGGWGLMEENRQPRYLRIVKNIFVRCPKKCVYFIAQKDLFLKQLLPTLYLCTAAAPAARITCGDSGSPLLKDEQHIVGINKAFCPSRDDLPLSGYRNLHASVYAYADFIKTVMKK